MFTVGYNLKDFFFDRLTVQKTLDKGTARYLNNAGGFIRKTARNSMRPKGYARKPPKNLTGKAYQKWLAEAKAMPASPPGQPPHRHTQDEVASLRKILYGFNPYTQGIIVGPVLLNGSKRKNPTIPELHEFGGSQLIREKRVGQSWVPMGKRGARPGQPTRSRRVSYPARPYMRPALAKAATKFPTLWYGSGGAAA